MATGGNVEELCPEGKGSENLEQFKCQPCLEDGHLHEAVGMCIDCQDYLCLKCYNGHTLPKPSRNHQLMGIDQMLQSHTRISPKDMCTEKCSFHDGKIIQYYCTTHCLLGCTVCVTLDHKTCHDVLYIPQVAKELTSNEGYRHVESQLKSALAVFKKVSENAEQNVKELDNDCDEALENIKEYRIIVEQAFDKIEAKLVEQAKLIKTKEIADLTAVRDKYNKAYRDLKSALANIEKLHNEGQNCSSYIEMMRTNEHINSLDTTITHAEVDESCRKRQIRFTQNQETLQILNTPAALGTLLGSSKETLVSAKHIKDINVKTGDCSTCNITGLVILPDGRLVVAVGRNNVIKTVDEQNGQVLSQLKLSCGPWDIAIISKTNIAVSLPHEKTVAFVTVGDRNLSIDSKMFVNGTCYGLDYRNNKLAVSFNSPHKVQILNLQGTVLYDIASDIRGKPLFNTPYYLTYGQDDTSLFVSNCHSNSVLCVNMDGTVMATYIDKDLQFPRKPVIDSSGNVYVCSEGYSAVHQISTDCKKIRVMLIRADGLDNPCSLCLSEETNTLYVGMWKNDNVKVYKTEGRTQWQAVW